MKDFILKTLPIIAALALVLTACVNSNDGDVVDGDVIERYFGVKTAVTLRPILQEITQ